MTTTASSGVSELECSTRRRTLYYSDFERCGRLREWGVRTSARWGCPVTSGGCSTSLTTLPTTGRLQSARGCETNTSNYFETTDVRSVERTQGAETGRKKAWNMAEEGKPVEVSRRIEAPAALIFEILADPQRHADFDGSGMLRGATLDRPISDVGDAFTMKMHRLGDDYLMINYVVEFEPDRRIFWEPAPGDPSRAEDDDPSKVGIPAGYRWGYILTPDGDDATVVTEVFDYGRLPADLLRDGATWINGTNTVRESMAASLERLEKISTE